MVQGGAWLDEMYYCGHVFNRCILAATPSVLCFLDIKSEEYFSTMPFHHDVKPHYRPRCNGVRSSRLEVGAETNCPPYKPSCHRQNLKSN